MAKHYSSREEDANLQHRLSSTELSRMQTCQEQKLSARAQDRGEAKRLGGKKRVGIASEHTRLPKDSIIQINGGIVPIDQ